MDVVKFENSTTLIAVAGRALAIFLTLAHSREPSPNEKILKNLCSFLAQDVLGQIRDNSDSEIWSLTKLLDESRNKTVHLTDNYCRNSGFGAEKTLGEIVGYHQEHLVIYAKVLWNGLDLSKTFSAEDTIRAQLTAMKLWTSVFSLLPQKLQDEVNEMHRNIKQL